MQPPAANPANPRQRQAQSRFKNRGAYLPPVPPGCSGRRNRVRQFHRAYLINTPFRRGVELRLRSLNPLKGFPRQS